MSDLRVLVVAEDPLARAGLATVLVDLDGVRIIGQIAGNDDLPDMLPVYRPDVILWDLGWEALEAPAILAEIDVPILALLPGEELAPDVWAAGAAGILPRDSLPEQLSAALSTVAQGLRVLGPDFTARLTPTDRPALPQLSEPLTPREMEVLQLLAEGLTNKAIAHELAVSEHTVKFHVNAIMSKLDAQSRTEAVVSAMRLGLLLL